MDKKKRERIFGTAAQRIGHGNEKTHPGHSHIKKRNIFYVFYVITYKNVIFFMFFYVSCIKM